MICPLRVRQGIAKSGVHIVPHYIWGNEDRIHLLSAQSGPLTLYGREAWYVSLVTLPRYGGRTYRRCIGHIYVCRTYVLRTYTVDSPISPKVP